MSKVKTEKEHPDKCADCFVYQYALLTAKRKVARCRVWFSYANEFCFSTEINGVSCRRDNYGCRKSAIRGARRFCAAVGYECEIVKG